MSMLNQVQFAEAIKKTDFYNTTDNFKKNMLRQRPNILKLYEWYQQAYLHKIEHLKQNPNRFANDVLLIEQILNL